MTQNQTSFSGCIKQNISAVTVNLFSNYLLINTQYFKENNFFCKVLHPCKNLEDWMH